MEHLPAAEVEELLAYEEDTAGGLMNTKYVALDKNATVREAFEALRGNENILKTVTHVFLLDEGRKLAAAVPLGRLLIAEAEQPLNELAFRETLKVTLETDQERVIEYFDKYDLFALPVVDEDDILRGVITADDIIGILVEE
jgi:magnesium transporter